MPRNATPTALNKAPRSHHRLSNAASERHVKTILRFFQHQPTQSETTVFYLDQIARWPILLDTQRDQLTRLLELMKHHNRERDKHWFRLPMRAYESDQPLRFFDTPAGLRNTPLKKKKKP